MSGATDTGGSPGPGAAGLPDLCPSEAGAVPMTPNTLLQFVVFLGVLMVLAKPLGEYMGRVLQVETTFLEPVLRPVERGIYRLGGIAVDDRQDWKGYAWAVILFSLVSMAFMLLLQRVQHLLPGNPNHSRAGALGHRPEHLGELHHQHQLAVLRRRDHHEQPDPDAGPGGAQLHLGGQGHRGPGRAVPGHPPAQGHQPGQFLGGPHPHHPIHPAAPVHPLRAGAGQPGRGPEPGAEPGGDLPVPGGRAQRPEHPAAGDRAWGR